MAQHVCAVCGYIHDEEKHEERWEQLPPGWECPVCGTGKTGYSLVQAGSAAAAGPAAVATAAVAGGPTAARVDGYLGEWRRFADELEYNMPDIHAMAETGQSVKPGLGGHLPGAKVTEEIAAVGGFPRGQDIISPSRFAEIESREDLKGLVAELKDRSGGKPIGIKVAAGHIEKDLEVALFAEPDFITVDGRPGATGAVPKVVKDATSVPTIYTLHRVRKYLDSAGTRGVSLVITGGMRVSSDFIRALAMGADAVAIGTAALLACCCQQYRVCNTGQCPVGCTTQDPELRSHIDIDTSAKRVENYLKVCTEELREFWRLTGHGDIRELSIDDLCTTNSEISGNTDIEHV